MPITYLADFRGQNSGVSAAITSNVLSVKTGDHLVIVAGYDDNPDSTAWLVSNNGSWILWNQIADTNTTGNCRLVMWEGIAGAIPPNLITVTSTAGGATTDCKSLAVFVHRGYHASDPLPLGNIYTGVGLTDASRTITPSAPGSTLWMVCGDWNATNTFAAIADNTLVGTFHQATQATFTLIRPTTQPRPDSAAFTLGETDTSGTIAYIAFEIRAELVGNPPGSGNAAPLLDAKWLNFAARGQSWHSFWQDNKVSAGGNNIADSVTETAAANHSQSAVLSAAATIGESLVTADSLAATLSAVAVIAETATAADTQSGSVSTSAAVAETAAAADSQSATVTTAATLAEAAAASDSQSATVTALAIIAESAAATDTSAATLGTTSAIVETAAAAHSQTSALTATATLDEILAAADSAAAALVATASVTEMVSTDGLSLSGAMNAYGWFSGDLVPGGLYDPFLSLALAGQHATSGFAANLAGTAIVVETVASSESLTADAGTVTADLIEAATADDSQNVTLSAAASLSETAVLTSTPAVTLIAAAALNETVTALDSQSGIQATTASVTETVASSDSQTDITGTVSAALTETSAALDSQTSTQAAIALVAESVVVDHNQHAIIATTATVSDSAAAVDNASAGTLQLTALLESAAAVDLQSSLVLIQAAISESANVLESAFADLQKAATLIENAAPIDVVSATGGQDYPPMPWTRYYELVAQNRKQHLIAFNKSYQIKISAKRYDIQVFL